MHTLHSSLHFSSIWTTQEHCSCWIVWSYYYFGTEDLKTDQNKHCEQNSKWQRPAEVTKVCIEEASACGQVGWWKGCVHPLTAIHGDSTGTILLQGQGTIQRWTKLHWQPGQAATPGQRRRELLDQSDISYGLTGPAQLKAPRKGVWGYWWAADCTGVSQQCGLAARRANHTLGSNTGNSAAPPAQEGLHLQLPQRLALEKEKWFGKVLFIVFVANKLCSICNTTSSARQALLQKQM